MAQPRSLFSVLREAVISRDPVTGTLHPSTFERTVQHWIGDGAAARRPSSSLLLVGVDWSTRAGRTHRPGKRQGDQVLRSTAQITGSCLRATDVLGRLDDETLGVLLPNTPTQQAEHVARRIRAAVAERTASSSFPVTVSIGLTSGLATDPWSAAGDALGDAQLEGGNRIVTASMPVSRADLRERRAS